MNLITIITITIMILNSVDLFQIKISILNDIMVLINKFYQSFVLREASVNSFIP